jgi:hypothetical protein
LFIFKAVIKKDPIKEHLFKDEKYKDKIELPMKYSYTGIFPEQKKIKLFYNV